MPEEGFVGDSVSYFATVGIASAQAMAPRSKRKGVHFTNTSANTISLSTRAPAVLNSGVTLLPGGVYYEPDHRYRVWDGAWFAIAGGITSNLAIKEDL